MSELLRFQKVVDDWATAVCLPSNHKPTAGLYEENAELAKKIGLDQITLRTLAEQPISIFDCLGSDVIWLTKEEIRWMLPVLLKHGASSEEPVFARNVVDALEESFSDYSKWHSIKNKLMPTSLAWLSELSRTCCWIGWEDERRIKKHKNICQALFE